MEKIFSLCSKLTWAFSGMDTGRINNIRPEESIFLGCDSLNRQPIDGLFPDAVTLIAEVIESKKMVLHKDLYQQFKRYRLSGRRDHITISVINSSSKSTEREHEILSNIHNTKIELSKKARKKWLN